jgi:hypothetical protein
LARPCHASTTATRSREPPGNEIVSVVIVFGEGPEEAILDDITFKNLVTGGSRR